MNAIIRASTIWLIAKNKLNESTWTGETKLMKKALFSIFLLTGMAFAGEAPQPRILTVSNPITVKLPAISRVHSKQALPIEKVEAQKTSDINSRWMTIGSYSIDTIRMQDCGYITYSNRAICQITNSSQKTGTIFWAKKGLAPAKQMVLDCNSSLLNALPIPPDTDEETIFNILCPISSKHARSDISINPQPKANEISPEVETLINQYIAPKEPILNARWLKVGKSDKNDVYYDNERINFYKSDREVTPAKADMVQLWFREGFSDKPHFSTLYCSSGNPTPESAEEILYRKFCPHWNTASH